MVINRDPDYERKRQAEERLNTPEEVQKERLLEQLRGESVSIICLAVMYAKNFEETGADVTKALITAEKNLDTLERMYKKGYEDAREKMRKWQNEKENKNNKHNRNAGNGRTNGQNRYGPI